MSPRRGAPPSREPAHARARAGSIASIVLAAVCATAVLHTAPTEATSLRAPDHASLVAPYADGAPAGFSGGFAEQSCHACHFHADVNTGPGELTLSGVPERFAAGERYPLTITLSRPGVVVAGFQITARLKTDGTQAGTLAPAPGEEERIAIAAQNGIQYAGQRRRGTALAAPDTARWTVQWTAPPPTGAVQFHVAANAADNDESAEGDCVYTALAETAPAPPPARR